MARTFGLMIGTFMMVLSFAITAMADTSIIEDLDTAITQGDKEALSRLLAQNFHQNGMTDELFPRPISRDIYIDAAMELHRTFRHFRRHSDVVLANDRSMTLKVTYSGLQVGSYLRQPPSGNHIAVTALEIWRLKDGKLAELWRQEDGVAALRQITMWQPEPDLAYRPAPNREIVHFPAGRFLESIVADKSGNLYFTTLLTGKVTRLAPDGTVTPFAELPVSGGPGKLQSIMCLFLAEDGMMFANVLAPGTDHHGVWRITKEGQAEKFTTLPDPVLPNGITGDGQGHLYVADSGSGGVWQIELNDRSVRRWYDGDLLKRRPYIGIYPPTNGIQYWQGNIFAINSDRAQVVRIAVEKDGHAGPAAILAEGVPGDDFAIDEDGTLYVTTHPYNLLMRVTQNGERSIIAKPQDGIVGPTAATFARLDGAARKLYVVTDGGYYNPMPDQPQRPNIVEFEVSGP